MTDDELTTTNEVEYRLTKLMREYKMREPWSDICDHALRETFKERYPTWAADYELRIKWNATTAVVKLVLKSAVQLLGALAAKAPRPPRRTPEGPYFDNVLKALETRREGQR